MFRFKQFTINQDRCPMKVGTDGVLLGAWAGVRSSDRWLLDVGSGTGLIALMLAQRAPQAQVRGVDVDDVSQARENAEASPWGSRLSFDQCPVQEFEAEERFDLIVSNPPFFVDSLTCPDQGRTTARHAVRLSYEELRDASVRLLTPGGRLAVVLPSDGADRFVAVCAGCLALSRRTHVRTIPCRAPKRALLEFVAQEESITPQISELIVGMGAPEEYSPQYKALTRDFYLKF